MDEKIHFKITHGGVTRRFALLRGEEDLIRALKTRVLQIIGTEDASIFWKDEDSLIILDCEDDLKAAIDYAETKNKLACVSLVAEVESTYKKEEETEVRVVSEEESHDAFNGFPFVCDECNCFLAPSNGGRFKCTLCDNYDLCAACLTKGKHANHAFIRLLNAETEIPVSNEVGGITRMLTKDVHRCTPIFVTKKSDHLNGADKIIIDVVDSVGKKVFETAEWLKNETEKMTLEAEIEEQKMVEEIIRHEEEEEKRKRKKKDDSRNGRSTEETNAPIAIVQEKQPTAVPTPAAAQPELEVAAPTTTQTETVVVPEVQQVVFAAKISAVLETPQNPLSQPQPQERQRSQPLQQQDAPRPQPPPLVLQRTQPMPQQQLRLSHLQPTQQPQPQERLPHRQHQSNHRAALAAMEEVPHRRAAYSYVREGNEARRMDHFHDRYGRDSRRDEREERRRGFDEDHSFQRGDRGWAMRGERGRGGGYGDRQMERNGSGRNGDSRRHDEREQRGRGDEQSRDYDRRDCYNRGGGEDHRHHDREEQRDLGYGGRRDYNDRPERGQDRSGYAYSTREARGEREEQRRDDRPIRRLGDQSSSDYFRASQIPAHMTISVIDELERMSIEEMKARLSKYKSLLTQNVYSHNDHRVIFSNAEDDYLIGNIAIDLRKHLSSILTAIHECAHLRECLSMLARRRVNLREALRQNRATDDETRQAAIAIRPIILSSQSTLHRRDSQENWDVMYVGFMEADALRDFSSPPRVASADPSNDGLFVPRPVNCDPYFRRER